MNQLEKIRIELDQIDHAMRELFEKRMLLIQEVKTYKKLHELPILDLERERNMILHHVSQLKHDELKDAYTSFLTHVMSLSKDAQK